MKKILSMFCMLLVLAMLMTGCGSSTGSSTEEDDAETSSQVVVALWAEPETLCGGFTPNIYSGLLSRQIFDTLLVYEDDGTYAPMLATEWEYSEDGKDLTFTLRDDVSFHNGEKMTADDVVFSYNTIIEAGIADSMTNAMDYMEKVDDSHVKLVFKFVYGPGLKACASFNMPIFSKSAYEADPDGFARNPVGTGPYMFSEWKSGESITLVANDEYWGGAPSIQTCIVKLFDDDSTASLALQNGQIDVLLTPPSSDKERLENDETLQYTKTMGVNTYWIYFNHHEDSIFSDENLRLAVAYAIDKEAVLTGAINGEGKVIETIYPDFIEGVDPDYKAPSNDPEKSKEYLAKAGYPDGIEFTVVTSSRAAHYKAMEIVQGQLAEVGITMNLEKVEESTWWTDIHEATNYVMNSCDNQMFMPDIDDCYSLYRGGQALNFYGLDNAELNAAYDLQRETTDTEERLQACYDVCRIMGDQALNIPLYEWYNAVAAAADLKGVVACQMLSNYDFCDWSW